MKDDTKRMPLNEFLDDNDKGQIIIPAWLAEDRGWA